jgi:hypothetical protein
VKEIQRGRAGPGSPAGPSRRRGVRGTWVAYAALLLLSIPWYFPAGSGEPLVLGFPLWCLVALLSYVVVALLTVWRLDALWESAREDAGAAGERGRGG